MKLGQPFDYEIAESLNHLYENSVHFLQNRLFDTETYLLLDNINVFGALMVSSVYIPSLDDDDF